MRIFAVGTKIFGGAWPTLARPPTVFGEFQAKNLASSSNEVNELQELFRK